MINEYKRLACAVVIQACKDYKGNYTDPEKSRSSIEKWVRDGNIFTDLVLPNMDAEDIIRGMQNYGK